MPSKSDGRWFEVFRAGSYPQRDVSEAEVQALVENYEPTWRDAPVVVGHPKNDSPAYGWVSALKRSGAVLLAQFRNLVPEFVQAVRDGRYEKRSIKLVETDRGLYLGHVGFLGGVAPAVPGLAPVQFNNDEGVEYEFEPTEEVNMSDQQTTMGLTPELQAALDRQRDAMRTEFAEQLAAKESEFATKLETKNAEFAQRLGVERAARERAEIDADLDRREQAGTLAPALRKAGLAEFMLSLDDSKGDAIEFAAEDGAKKVSQRGFAAGLLDMLPKAVEFAEIAGSSTDPGKSTRSFSGIDTDGEAVDSESAELHARVAEYQSKHSGVSYEEALSVVQAD